MDTPRKELAEYGRRVAALLTALDSDLEPVQVMAMGDATQAAFDAVARALDDCPANERASLAPAIAELRRSSALVQDSMRRAQLQTGRRLSEIARARAALSQLDQRTSGESCDIAG